MSTHADKGKSPGRLEKREVRKDLPKVQRGTNVGVGKVYIRDTSNNRIFDADQQLVLERTGAKPLHVETISVNNLMDDGTYLSASDLHDFTKGAAQGATTSARLYNNGDRWEKFRSGPGWVVLVTALVGAGTALIAVLNGIFPPPPARVDATQSQALLHWAAEPFISLPTPSDPAAKAAATADFENRAARANLCLQAMQGNADSPSIQIPEVSCAKVAPSWWRKYWAVVCGGLAGVSVAVLALVKGWMNTALGKTVS